MSGYTDYFTVILNGGLVKDAARLLQPIESTRDDFNNWNARVFTFAKAAGKFTILEVKWPGANLKNHIPQVVSEALGM